MFLSVLVQIWLKGLQIQFVDSWFIGEITCIFQYRFHIRVTHRCFWLSSWTFLNRHGLVKILEPILMIPELIPGNWFWRSAVFSDSYASFNHFLETCTPSRPPGELTRVLWHDFLYHLPTKWNRWNQRFCAPHRPVLAPAGSGTLIPGWNVFKLKTTYLFYLANIERKVKFIFWWFFEKYPKSNSIWNSKIV